MGERPGLSAIVVSFNTRERTLRCVERARVALSPLDGDLWVVDNASEDGTAAAVRERFPDVRLIENDENVGYGRGCNQGMREAEGRHFLLLNSDVEVTEEAVRALIQRLGEDPSIALVSPSLAKEDGSAAISARRFPSPLREAIHRSRLYRVLPRSWRSGLLLGAHARPEHVHDPDWVTGACLLVRREAFEDTEGFDEGIFLYGEELEWCARLRRAGWRVSAVPHAKVTHAGAASPLPSLGDRRYSLALEGDLRYLIRYRGRGVLRIFCLVRTVGLAWEAVVAWVTGDREAFRRSRLWLKEHRILEKRYLSSGESDPGPEGVRSP